MFPSAIEALRAGLRELGWIDGENFVLEYSWSEGRFDRLTELAEDLARRKVDVIIAPSSIYAEAARRSTATIPIVFVSHADPLGSGHVVSLARPGGNITGLSLLMTETNAKAVEILKEAIPGLTSVAVIFDPATPSHGPGLRAVEAAGSTLGVRVRSTPIRAAAEFETAFQTIAADRAEAVLVLSTPLYIASAQRLADLAIAHRLPSLFGPKEHTATGGLLSYSPDRADLWRRGAGYVDRILKGAQPSELPVQQPTKFELVINLKTAKALGVTLPPALVARADEVIE
jgi:putative ABC transport system substrate-binding protein